MAKAEMKVALFLTIFREAQSDFEVLLQKRQNTGYMDGKWDFGASGHLENNGETPEEGMIREAKEELGITVNPEAMTLQFIGVSPEEQYVKMFFEVMLEECEGEPRVMEPEKNAGLMWAPLANLPEDIIPYLPKVVENTANDVFYGVL